MEVPQITAQGWGKVPHPAGIGGTLKKLSYLRGTPEAFCQGYQFGTHPPVAPQQGPNTQMVTLSILAGWVSVGDPVGSGCQNIFRPAEARRCDTRWVVADLLLRAHSVEPRSPRVVQTIGSF